MSLYIPPETDRQPEVVLVRWSIYRVDAESMHFVGRHVGEEGRVSSAIRSFDPKTMIGTTRSGRRYMLGGPSGYDSDGDYVWSCWKKFNRVSSEEAISVEELTSALGEAAPAAKVT